MDNNIKMSIDQSNSFRFQAKYGLITYAQCGDLDPWRVVSRISELGGECIIGRETHADGGLHLHAFCQFEPKLRSSDPRVFDVDGHHPNIQPSFGRPEVGYDYAIKDGDVVAGGLERPGTQQAATPSKWATIVASETEDEFWAAVASLDPRALCVNFTSLRAYAGHRYRVDRHPYRTPAGICFDTGAVPELDRWVECEMRINKDIR